MIERRPTSIPRVARKRIRDYVQATGNRCFTAKVVAAELLTLARLGNAGLLTATSKNRTIIYHLAEGADVDQENRFEPAFKKIRHWTNATEKYTFTAAQVEVHGEVLDMMVKGGLLERKGWRYTVFWRSLAVNWQLRVGERAGGLIR